MFRRTLSQIVGVFLVVLIASPVTAPFSTFDFAPAAQFANSVVDAGNTSAATPVAAVSVPLPDAFDGEMLASVVSQLHTGGIAAVFVLRL